MEQPSNLSINNFELLIKLIETDIRNELEVKKLVKALKSVNNIILTLLRINDRDVKTNELLQKALNVRRTILRKLEMRTGGTYLVSPATLMTLVDVCNILYNGIKEGKVSLKEWISRATEGIVEDDPIVKVNVDIVKCITALNEII